MDGASDPNAARKSWLSVLAKAKAEDVARLWQQSGHTPEFELLRTPEVGAAMVRGRAGAVGAPFNLGEMTITRCSIRLSTGEVGHGYVQGRSKDHALHAALTDAMMQTAKAPQVDEEIIAPLHEIATQRRATRAAKAAATKVDFFTLVRGED